MEKPPGTGFAGGGANGLELLEWQAKSGTGILVGQGFGVLYSKNRVPVLPLFLRSRGGAGPGIFLCFLSTDAGSPVFMYFPSRPGRVILPCLGVLKFGVNLTPPLPLSLASQILRSH